MKKLLSIIILGIFFINASFAQDKEASYFSKTYRSSEIKNLYVRTSGGGISVNGIDGDEARVEIYVKGNKLSKAEIEDRLKDYELSVKKDGETINCIAKRKNENKSNNWKNGLSISFKIYAPEKISTDLVTSGGSISLKNLTGNLSFTTSGGGLKLQSLGGNINGRTSGGGITLNGCRDNIEVSTSGGGISAADCKGDLKLSTSGGGLTLKNLAGNIKASTSGGGIYAENIKGDFVTSTSGGSIKLENMMASIKASTSGGGITADLKTLGKYLTLSTSAGSIHVNMPMDKGMDLDLDGNRVKMPEIKNFSGKIGKNRVKGTVNGGGIAVSMDANSGGIYINE